MDNTPDSSAETGSASPDAGILYDAGRFHELSIAFPGIAHDMRGFLNNLALNLELLKGVSAPSAQSTGNAERYRDVALQQIRNLDKSIRSLLEYLDCEDTPLQSVDVNALSTDVHAMVKSHARHMKKNIIFTTLERPAFIQAHAPALRRALTHILLTVIKFTKGDGRLVGQVRKEGGRVVINLQGEWDGAQLAEFVRAFGGENTTSHNMAYVTLVKGREYLRTIGSDVRLLKAGKGPTVEIGFTITEAR